MWLLTTRRRRGEVRPTTSRFRPNACFTQTSARFLARHARCSSNSARSTRDITTAICKARGSFLSPKVGFPRTRLHSRSRNSNIVAGSSLRARVDVTAAACLRLLSYPFMATRNLTRHGASTARSTQCRTTGRKQRSKIRFPTPLTGSIEVLTDPVSGSSFSH